MLDGLALSVAVSVRKFRIFFFPREHSLESGLVIHGSVKGLEVVNDTQKNVDWLCEVRLFLGQNLLPKVIG